METLRQRVKPIADERAWPIKIKELIRKLIVVGNYKKFIYLILAKRSVGKSKIMERLCSARYRCQIRKNSDQVSHKKDYMPLPIQLIRHLTAVLKKVGSKAKYDVLEINISALTCTLVCSMYFFGVLGGQCERYKITPATPILVFLSERFKISVGNIACTSTQQAPLYMALGRVKI